MAMAYSKKFPFLISILLFVLHLHVSTAQTAIKGGYWFPASGFAVSNINSSLFTHLFCAFADVNPNTYQVTISSSNAPQFSTFTQTVQQKNPSVKTLLSIGGGASNPSIFSAMASQASTRKSFIDSSIQLARSNNFHGLDLDWEYPSTGSDMTNYGSLIREWRSALLSESRTSGNPVLLLVAAVFYSSKYYSLEYPIQAITCSLDWANIMAYDFYGPNWYPNRTAPPAALYALNNSANRVSGDEGIRAWIGSGVPAKKLVLGVPFYGYAWRLLNPNNPGLFAPANGSAIAGDGSIGYTQKGHL
ncbi:Chitotriosidase-1 protein [Spatholobus suberectus]|nr:Chitotriosidase-1 protein [Spatholobus suberectus]